MSLRDALKVAVARCAPIETQHATFRPDYATAHATTVQQRAENPHAIRVSPATAYATTAQLGVEGCTEFQGSLTAHRLASDLIRAAMRRCDQFGDDDTARQEMQDQCLALPPHLQADLLGHFDPSRKRLK